MSKEKLELHKVNIEHMEQYNQLLKYVFQVTKHTMQQVGWEEKEFIRAKLPSFEKASVLGWFDKENLVSQCVVIQCKFVFLVEFTIWVGLLELELILNIQIMD